ncbi:DUF6207 family protein [Streptomyces sp. Tu 3180]|uniref:DUF6207 family protein n=1 Tax=Streptomyces sp. Tu 3180 TaxID=2682611 RepID=UPI00135C4F39|nr:DUF6207 family protein [Streptomyces sp. Tu 3180]KAF3469413.1 hypothetical protein GL259_37695 [Streptomyces sp. Tu 3180]
MGRPGPGGSRVFASLATDEVHVSESGLVVVDVAAVDGQSAFALQEALASLWAATAVERTTRDVGRPGVRLRCSSGMRQAPG